MGKKKKRYEIIDDADGVSDDPIGLDELDCAQPQIIARLVNLAIIAGAEVGLAPGYWTTAQFAGVATVRATTAPPDFPVAWDGGQASVTAMERSIDRTFVGSTVVGATLNNPRQQVQLDICDLTALAANLRFNGGLKDYAGFAPATVARLSATTNPANATVWGRLAWSAGAAAGPANTHDVDITAVGDQIVTVTLGTAVTGQLTRQLTLHVCAWPLLEVTEVTFSQGHRINNDTAAYFDRLWQRGRVPNPPQCYTRSTRIELRATLSVTRHPTDSENVTVRATATIGGVPMTWTSAAIAVAPGANTVAFPAAVLASQPLPGQVGFYPAAQLDWEMTDPNGNAIAIGSTTHDLYVTLGDPVAPNAVYWTLLHNSCANGAGSTTEGPFVDTAFNSYTGRNMRRKRDNKPMTYWDPRQVAGGNGNTQSMLSSDTTRQFDSTEFIGAPHPGREAVATGTCQAWAASFIDMVGIHGVNSAHMVQVTNIFPMSRFWLPLPLAVNAGGFLVANWTFNPPIAVNGAMLTHSWGADCVAGVYAHGQNNLTPPPAFRNHYIVWYGAGLSMYDPSYGTRFQGPDVGTVLQAWETHSISGLYGDGPAPNAGYATVAMPPPARRLVFNDIVTGNNL
jgi:hypothetical protein